MSDHLDSVKNYVRAMEGWRKSSEAKGDDSMASAYTKRLAFLRATIDELEDLRRITKPIPASYGDLSDLPSELMKELSGIKVDDLEQQIYTIIKSGGDAVDLDSVLIELFRRFEIVQTRKYLQNKLWRMAQKELIFSVPGRKGVYTAIQPDDKSGGSAGFKSAQVPASEWGDSVNHGFGGGFDDDVPF